MSEDARYDGGEWRTEWADEHDRDGIFALFRRAFGHDMSPALWRWKYEGADPIGAVVRRDGIPVAFYGGSRRTVLFDGVPTSAVQICDVMVDPAWRGLMTRHGPFHAAATRYLGQLVGTGRPHPLAFGFPSERAFRLGQRLGLYAAAGAIACIDWAPLAERPDRFLTVAPFTPAQAGTVDRLWRSMARALRHRIVGLRDFARIRRRYLEHPTLDYRLSLVRRRFTGLPYGLVVTKEEGDDLVFVDAVARPERMAALVRVVRAEAHATGRPRVRAWVSAPDVPLFAPETGAVSTTEIVVPAAAIEGAIPADRLADRWWLMVGDTDFR